MQSSTSSSMGRAPISSLYVLKALCAFGVVILHAPLGEATDAVRLLCGVAVLIFFMITGYFLYSPDREVMLARLGKSIKKVVWTILLLNLMFYPIWPIQGEFSEKYMMYFNWIFLGLTPGFFHLWYLTALLEGLIILWVWHKFIRREHTMLYILLAVVLWIVRCMVQEYRPALFGVPSSLVMLNVITNAFPFLIAGMLAKRYESKIVDFNWGGVIILSIFLSYMNQYVEILPSFLLAPWLLLLRILSLFFWALQHKSWGAGSLLETIGRDLSGNIYYFHMAFIYVVESWLGFENFGALYAIVLSVLWAWFLVCLQDRMGWNILR